MSGTILPTYAADAYLYGTPQAVPQQAVQPSILGSLFGRPASPLVSQQTANQTAIDTLLNIAGATANDAPYGGPGPTGARGTGNPISDIPNAISAFGPAMATFADPTGLPGAVVGGMIGAAARAHAGIPNPTTPEFGMRAATRGLTEMARGISPEERATRTGFQSLQNMQDLEDQGMNLGYSSLAPEAAVEAATLSDAIGLGIGPESAGYGAPAGPTSDDENSNSTAAGQDAAGPGDPGAAGEGDGDNYAIGGLVGYARGGVIQLEGGGKVAIGPGGGLDDLIPTSINGQRAAALSDGEFVVPADVVSMMGDGSSNAGARRLYDLVRQIRQEKTGTSKQAGPLPVGELLKRTMS